MKLSFAPAQFLSLMVYYHLVGFSADENVAASAGEDPAMYGSRPLTRGYSNLTSAHSSRFVDFGGGLSECIFLANLSALKIVENLFC